MNDVAEINPDTREEFLGFLDFLKSKYPTLKKGDSGDDVKKLQGLLGISQDGQFGSGTESKVKAAQKKAGLPVTGVADKTTWKALESGGASSGKGGNKKPNAAATGINALVGVLSSAIAGNQPAVVAPVVVPQQEETPWLLYGGLALAGVLVLGGTIYFVTKD